MRFVLALSLLAPALAHADDIEFDPEPARTAKPAPKAKHAPAKKAKPADKAKPEKEKLAPAKEPQVIVSDVQVVDSKPAPVAAPTTPAVSSPPAPAQPPRVAQASDDEAPLGQAAPPPAKEEPKDEPKPAVDKVAPAPVKKAKWIEPYGAIAGGMRIESLHQPDMQKTSSQNPTVAVSRLGLRGGVGEHITFASEFEASLGGPLGYGSSVWEGQAAVAIRDQFVRYTTHGFSIAAGRATDPASIDYVSAHVGDLLYSDLYTRDPLLYSGYDRGNGLFASYDITKNLTAGLTFHSTNPTGITGTLEIGGKLQPFDRPFFLAAAQVGNSQNNLPDQNLHIYFGSPSLIFHTDNFEAKAEVQMYSLDTQVAVDTDQTIRGYNFRLGARGVIDTPVGQLIPFANVSRNKNEILDPTDSMYRLPNLFKSYTFSTGVDYNYSKRSGVGFQYALVNTTEPDQHVREHYLNLGTSYWIEDSFAVGVRASVFAQQISGETMTTGSRSLFVTARLVLQ
jgi:hypothetical protein